MAATITVPTTASLGGFATEVATNLAAKGDYDARVANALITLATEATTDINALQAGTSIAAASTTAAGTMSAADKIALVRYVRGVVFANVADLAAFTVAGNDGLTYAAGERVLLAAHRRPRDQLVSR